jgi:hypothetical protein
MFNLWVGGALQAFLLIYVTVTNGVLQTLFGRESAAKTFL